MRWAVAALLLACAPAWAQPAPPPIGWPSDICHASGADANNAMCGTCSTSVVYSTPDLGTYWGWVCRWPDGQWRTHEITRPWGARLFPSGPGLAAAWAANVIPSTPAEEAKYAQLIALARPHLANVWRPPEPVAPPPPAWIVAAVSTGQRPSFTLIGTRPVRETGRFLPTLTAGKPTPCECAGEGNSATLNGQTLCAAQGYKTANGAARLAYCIPIAPP
jgi:hypothetical protein